MPSCKVQNAQNTSRTSTHACPRVKYKMPKIYERPNLATRKQPVIGYSTLMKAWGRWSVNSSTATDHFLYSKTALRFKSQIYGLIFDGLCFVTMPLLRKHFQTAIYQRKLFFALSVQYILAWSIKQHSFITQWLPTIVLLNSPWSVNMRVLKSSFVTRNLSYIWHEAKFYVQYRL